jgi:nucleoside-diphosphate-sugar epimerase
MKRILVTGSQGYLGSVLTEMLTESGYDCTGYDTGFFRNSLLYPPAKTQTITRDARHITEEDLRGVHAVVHLAGISNDPMGKLTAEAVYDPTRAYTFNIAEKCKKLGVRFVFASSCSVYGIGGNELLTETSTTNPQTFYSLNKQQIEDDLKSLSDKNFSPIALRFATVFGSSPRIRFDVVINMLAGMAFTNGNIVLNSDGKAWRPNLHIRDACEAMKRAIEIDHQAGELLVLNVGSDENNLQIIEIARTIQRLVPGCELKFLSEEPDLDKEGLIRDRKVQQAGKDSRTYKVSFERIKEVFPGFSTEWNVERGVKEMIDRFIGLGLNNEVFKHRGFYRLQQLEYLLENGCISSNLFWLKDESSLK